jgi:type III restriction enzyme
MGSTRDVDFWTSKAVRESERSHLSGVVMDTDRWEQTAAFYLDSDQQVIAFVKNFNLGFAIPYSHNGDAKEYLPDFLARLRQGEREVGTLILETKGYDPLASLKFSAAQRWVAAVNAEGSCGRWAYRMARNPAEVPEAIRSAAEELSGA